MVLQFGAHMAFAGLIGGFRKPAVQEFARVLKDVIPLKSRAGIGFVGLNVEMAEDALVGFELVIGKFVGDDLAVGALRVIAFNFGQGFAERGSELDQGFILFRCEVVLDKFLALNGSFYRLRPRGTADKVGSSNPTITEVARDGDDGLAFGVRFIPFG